MNVTLKFAKEELKCSLGLEFLGELLDETNLSIEEVGEKMQKNPFKLLPQMIFISARIEAELNGDDFKTTQRDLIKLIEADGGLGSPNVTKFVNAFTKSMTGGVPEEEPAEEGSDKPKK